MEYIFTTNALCRHYKHFKALDGLSMHIPKGAIYGFIGKNGSGKTTLIRLLCGLQAPTSGSFTLYGIGNRDREIVKARRRMGAIVETPSVYMDMTAMENLKQQARILGLPSFRRLEDILRLVGLEDAGRKKARHFSLGMRQRLGIAVALVGDPDFLVLDEPINGLDPQGIVEVRELILKLNRERQITVLVSSHILGELSKIATCYGFIDRGTMVREISASQLEEICRKCIRMVVSDTQILSCLLDELGIEYKILSDTRADVYGKVTLSKMIIALEKRGCETFSANEREESLESFYMNLVGISAGEKEVRT